MNIFKTIYWLFNRPAEWRLLELQSNQQYLKDRMDVLNSPLWDENFYVCRYETDISKTHLYPLDHYLQIGWKKGFIPSAAFEGDAFGNEYQTRMNPLASPINPLVYFLHIGRFVFPGFYYNPYPVSEKKLAEYLENKQKRRSKKAVYTCITNGYDNLREMPGHYYLDSDWDYICFTDDIELIQQGTLGAWEIRPLIFTQSDPSRINRYHKVFPHLALPEYEQSIYLDAKVNILSSYIFDAIAQCNQDLYQPVHAYSGCLYEESKWILQENIDKEILTRQLDLYKKEGYPAYHGFRENCIIFRKHHNPKIIAAMEEWWEWIRDWCRRDQTSYCYVLWKHGLDAKNPLLMNSPFVDYKNFCLIRHIALSKK